ncbi:MAG: NAD(P)-dependent oxidoreductase [Patescibacteria group bacterium]
MKIGFFGSEGWEEAILRKNFPDADFFFTADKLSENNIPTQTDFDIISVFVGSPVTAKVIAKMPNLKFITTRSVGFDHVDLAACKKKGIAVAYVPGYGDNTVAEYAFGLLLNLTRKIYQAIDEVKEYCDFKQEGLRGVDLAGKTIGIVGTGRIGKQAIKIAKGFGLNVLAYDPFPNKDFAKEIDFQYVPLEELLKNSDFITLHAPYNKDTHHLINKKNILFIKKGAYLVNTARGGLVETDALVMALDKKILAGVALDVLEEEGETKEELELLMKNKINKEEFRIILENHILMKMPNVLITPHNAFNSKEAMQRILEITIENIKAFVAGRPTNLTS